MVPYSDVNLNVIVFVLTTIVSEGKAPSLNVRAELTSVLVNGPLGNVSGCDLAVNMMLLVLTVSLALIGLNMLVLMDCDIRALFLVGAICIARVPRNVV